MNLIIDIGNSRTKIAVFDGDIMLFSEVLTRLKVKHLQAIKEKFNIDAVILSNTGEIVTSTYDYLKNNFILFWHLDHLSPLPIKNLYETPQTLGKDRLAAAVGAFYKFHGANCLIIDLGTCITLDFISEKGEFLGGNISPGIRMRLKAMNRYTAKLPLVDIDIPESLFGTNTKNALQNGAVKGAFREIETFINEVSTKYDVINVILTGGDAHLFEKYTKNKIFVSPNLILEGLNEILRYNAH
ncbi:MAG: type III pantothenate kinase [Saprospiraceae bacterium]|nr:type III pantothenate kinase [Saprospiraceae bacterium]